MPIRMSGSSRPGWLLQEQIEPNAGTPVRKSIQKAVEHIHRQIAQPRRHERANEDAGEYAHPHAGAKDPRPLNR